ncbi:MAG: hypothetical protein H3C43_00660 [Leptonema sp. (in: Bacteria)]|nr:hypothetical protein [Leptonema sp. (in: bacteria)]
MNIGGWVIMILSLVFVTLFFLGSLYMVIRRGSKSGQLHSTFDETPDMKDIDQ